MRILLDECLPRRLVRDLNCYSVTTVPRQGWAGRKDSELLALAEGEFDVFVTSDSNLAFQQNLRQVSLIVVVVRAVNSRYETIQPLVPNILHAIASARRGEVVGVG